MISHAGQAATPALERASTLAEIKNQTPNGLFSSTIDPEKLTKFKNSETYSTMVHEPGNLKEHKGFVKKDIKDLVGKDSLLSTTNIGMQSAAALSGQYYLTEITNQLEDIDSKLDDLIEFHHDERLAILKNAKNRLEEIIKRQNVSLNDINEIRQLRNSVGEVFEEYQTRLNRELKEVSCFKSNHILVEKRLESYVKEIDKIKFNTQVSYQADKLSVQAELAEISVRMKLDFNNPMLKELYLQLEDNKKNSFSLNINKKIIDIFRPIDMHADDIVKEGKDLLFIDKDRKKLLKSVYDRSNDLEKTLDSSRIDNLLNDSLEEQNKEQEILIVPDSESGEQRVFISVDEKE